MPRSSAERSSTVFRWIQQRSLRAQVPGAGGAESMKGKHLWSSKAPDPVTSMESSHVISCLSGVLFLASWGGGAAGLLFGFTFQFGFQLKFWFSIFKKKTEKIKQEKGLYVLVAAWLRNHLDRGCSWILIRPKTLVQMHLSRCRYSRLVPNPPPVKLSRDKSASTEVGDRYPPSWHKIWKLAFFRHTFAIRCRIKMQAINSGIMCFSTKKWKFSKKN